jgi:FkbM family methyltransferase
VTSVSLDPHAEALRLHADGRPAEAVQTLAAEVGARVGDPELLNDLGVLALEAGRPQLAEAVLRTSLLVTPDDDAAANVAALDALRAHGFVSGLMQTLVGAAAGPVRHDNFNPLSHPAGPPGPLVPLGPGVAEIMGQAPTLEWLYGALADDASRSLMLRLFALRLLGAGKVALDIEPSHMRAAVEAVRSLRVQEQTVSLGFMDWHADRFDLSPLGVDAVVDAHPMNIVDTFVLEQYACPAHEAARVRPGDIVIDGGGCWGDTALYLAGHVGPAGRVVTYEFLPSNLEVLEANLARNPELASRIEIERRAVWDSSDARLAIEGAGPAAHVGLAQDGDGVVTRALDDTPAALGLDRIDFIKLDVEGAELRALHGAEQVLRRHRPRLAVALYHHTADWVEIPAFLDGLGLGYRFSLGHFTLFHGETVLFAWCDDTA